MSRGQLGRQLIELMRTRGKGGNAGRDDHLSGRGCLAVGEPKAKTAVMPVDPLDQSRLDCRRNVPLHPKAIVDEPLEGNGGGDRLPTGGLVGCKAERILRIRDVRGHVRGS